MDVKKNKRYFYQKVKRKLHERVVIAFRSKSWYPKIYISYWHYIFSKSTTEKGDRNYISSVPNPEAGVGHQISNWIAGFIYSKKFELNFAHIPFHSLNWDAFLGLGQSEVQLTELIRSHGYRKVLLPLFNENLEAEYSLIKNIIRSYNKKKVVFITEQDQSYDNHAEAISDLQKRFLNAKDRINDKLVYDSSNFNIAIHIRRGDINLLAQAEDSSLAIRWQDEKYFEKVLEAVLLKVASPKPVHIFLFSQGLREDFNTFDKFNNLHFCLDMSAQDSFLHMVNADLLITSKSSFSYKPALLNSSIKISPKNFWHNYPDDKNWILVDDNGQFNTESLAKLF